MSLPNTPVDIYLNGVLMESNVSSIAKITTESLPAGTTIYKLIVQDSNDPLKVNAEQISLSPGQIASINMSSL